MLDREKIDTNKAVFFANGASLNKLRATSRETGTERKLLEGNDLQGYTAYTIKDTLKVTGYDIKAVSKILYKDPVLQSMTAKFYKDNYWNKMRGDEINSQLIANEIFIFGVNAGMKLAIAAAQMVLGVTADGKFGEQTLMDINSCDVKEFDKKYDTLELTHYNRLITKNPKLKIYANGWRNRAESV